MYFDVSRGKLNGVFNYLSKKYSSNYENIAKVSGTNVLVNSVNYNPIGSITHDSTFYFVGLGYVFNVSLMNHYVHILHYSINQNTNPPRKINQWKLQGSLDGGEWETLSEVHDCNEKCSNESIHSYPAKEGVYNAFQVVKLNENSDNSTYFDLYKFEIFGSVCLTNNCHVPIRMYITKCYLNNGYRQFSIVFVIALIH